MRVPIKITDDMQRQLGCVGVTLEAVFVESRESRATVFVFYVDPARSLLKNPSPVVKYSERRFAIPRAKCLKLATPSYYRSYEGDASGIRDEMEARYQEDIRSFLTKYRTMDASSVALVSGNATYGIDGFWMFCTSLEPTLTQDRQFLRREFAADCETKIADPHSFARTLGAAFAAHSSWSDVDLSPWDKIMRQLRPPEMGDKVVWVYHGPVLYSDEAEKLVESFPVLHRSVVVSFVKRRRFARHNEYRFKVKINGRPKESQYFLPISPELRRLAKIEWDAC